MIWAILLISHKVPVNILIKMIITVFEVLNGLWKLVNWLNVIIVLCQRVIPVFWCKACRSHSVIRRCLGAICETATVEGCANFSRKKKVGQTVSELVWKWHGWDVGRYRLAGRGYVRLQISLCPGGHLSAGSAVGWDLNGAKWIQYWHCIGGQLDVLSAKKKIWVLFLVNV